MRPAQRARARNAGKERNRHDADGENDDDLRILEETALDLAARDALLALEEGGEREREQDRGDRQQHVEHAAEQAVDSAAEVAREEAEGAADHKAEADREGRDQHRVEAAVDEPGQHVPPDAVAAEQMSARRPPLRERPEPIDQA